ncbi:MAG TPA: multidrug efflux RND transporter permease subunit [Polyangiaceae bacterium]|nr:multidrug efflux RND transporter permease subunit [Polyangiaceae bacterium]
MAAFFVRRPIVAIVIAIITVLGGLVSLGALPISLFPDIVPPQIMVTATYTGADAVTIEQSVATPMEQQTNGVDDMLYMQSTNANDGTMLLTVTFDIDTQANIDQVNVQNRMAQAQPNLPTDVSQYGLTMRKSTGLPLMLVSLFSPQQSYDALFLANYANINIVDALYRVQGVGEVRVFGAGDYAMRIWVQPDRLASLGLSVPELANAIRKQSAVNPSGQVGARPGPNGLDMTYTVRAPGRLQTAEQFGDIIVRSNPDGSIVRLRDVSRIELGALNYQQIGRVNGQPGVGVAVFQAPGSNALAVSEGVRGVMNEIRERFPSDLDYTYTLDTTQAVSEGVNDILKTLGEALVLVIAVVFIFLQNWRATLIPMLAVPVSLIGTFLVFPALGFSINTLSLFGLVLAIGLVVDDAIVVVEAVEHHIAEGLSPREATLQAMREVSGPVVAIALILAAVFIPVGVMGGIQGRLNQQFALTIAVSVIISAFNALSLSPALSALLLRPRQPRRGLIGRIFGGFERGMQRANSGYVRLSHGLIRKPLIGVLLLAAFAGSAGLLGKKLPSSFLPQEDYGYLLLNVQLPAAASLERTDAVTRRIDKVLQDTEGVSGFNTIVGFSLLTRVTASNNAFYFVQLKPWGERPGLDSKQIGERLNQKIRAVSGDAVAFAIQPPAIPGLGSQGGFSFWLQDRSGGSVEFLNQQLQNFLAAARKRPELANVNSPFSAAVPQIYTNVDRDKALRQGVDLGDVYQTLQTYLGGLYVNQFNRFGRQWRVFLQAEGNERMGPEQINQFYVKNNTGHMVPLSALGTVEPTFGPQFTNRFNVFRAAQVTGAAAPGYSSGQAMDALEEVARQTLPREMGYDWSDLSYQEKKASAGGGRFFALSILVVFLILAALYESWSLPFSVLLTVPVAVCGALLGLLLRKYDLDVYAKIGIVMLIGLSAKNAILIVEFAKDKLEHGMPLVQAALEGAKLRLRPILMTSFAFIFGCVPLWIAEGSGATSRRILGTVVISGMVAATLIAIFLIPLLFVLIERVALRAKRRAAAEPALAPGE